MFDQYLVTMLPQPIYKRRDLRNQLPVVYHGKTVEEWYSQYVQLLLKSSKAQQQRAYAIQWLRNNALFLCETCNDGSNSQGRHAAWLRMYAGRCMCRICYQEIAHANDEPPLPHWSELPVFDPFKDLS